MYKATELVASHPAATSGIAAFCISVDEIVSIGQKGIAFWNIPSITSYSL